MPDAKTIWLFRSKLETFHLTRKLFDKFSEFLASSGFEARKGQIVDATIVRVPIQRNTRKENEAIKEGKASGRELERGEEVSERHGCPLDEKTW